MIELLVLGGVVAVGGLLLLAALKLLFSLLILPLKLGFWLLKLMVGLVIMVPLAVIAVNVFSIAAPLLLVLVFLPLLALGGLVLLVVKLVH